MPFDIPAHGIETGTVEVHGRIIRDDGRVKGDLPKKRIHIKTGQVVGRKTHGKMRVRLLHDEVRPDIHEDDRLWLALLDDEDNIVAVNETVL